MEPTPRQGQWGRVGQVSTSPWPSDARQDICPRWSHFPIPDPCAKHPRCPPAYQLHPVPMELISPCTRCWGQKDKTSFPPSCREIQPRAPVQTVTMELTFTKQLPTCASGPETPACQPRPPRSPSPSPRRRLHPLPVVLGTQHWTAGTPWSQTSGEPAGQVLACRPASRPKGERTWLGHCPSPPQGPLWFLPKRSSSCISSCTNTELGHHQLNHLGPGPGSQIGRAPAPPVCISRLLCAHHEQDCPKLPGSSRPSHLCSWVLLPRTPISRRSSVVV